MAQRDMATLSKKLQPHPTASLRPCLGVAQIGAEEAAAIERLSVDIKASEKDAAPLNKELQPLQAKATALEQGIEDAGGAPLKKQKQKVAQLQQVSNCLPAHPTLPWHAYWSGSIRRPLRYLCISSLRVRVKLTNIFRV
jgi:hypothetical protein